jgi:hypothetical protein
VGDDDDKLWYYTLPEHQQAWWEAVVLPVLTGTGRAYAGTSLIIFGDEALYRPI